MKSNPLFSKLKKLVFGSKTGLPGVFFDGPNGASYEVQPDNGVYNRVESRDDNEPPRLPVFRPFVEPLLNPKRSEDEPRYKIYQNAFRPKDIGEISLPRWGRSGDSHGEDLDERAHVYAPNGASVETLLDALLSCPTDELTKLLPEGANKEEFLPAIKVAIKLVTWKKSALAKCKSWIATANRRWQGEVKFVGFPEDVAFLQKFYQDRLASELGSTEKELDPAQPPLNFQFFNDASEPWKARGEALKSAYAALGATFHDYQAYGLLNYRPYLQTKHVASMDATSIEATIISRIASWAQIYELFSRDRWGEGHLASWEGKICRDNIDIHRLIQGLAACVINQLPEFPDVSKYQTSKDYFEDVITILNTTSNYLDGILEQFLLQTPRDKPSFDVIDAYRTEMRKCALQSTSNPIIIDDVSYSLTTENLVDLPVHLIPAINVEHAPSMDDNEIIGELRKRAATNSLARDAFIVYSNYIKNSGELLKQLTGFTGKIPI